MKETKYFLTTRNLIFFLSTPTEKNPYQNPSPWSQEHPLSFHEGHDGDMEQTRVRNLKMLGGNKRFLVRKNKIFGGVIFQLIRNVHLASLGDMKGRKAVN